MQCLLARLLENSTLLLELRNAILQFHWIRGRGPRIRRRDWNRRLIRRVQLVLQLGIFFLECVAFRQKKTDTAAVSFDVRLKLFDRPQLPAKLGFVRLLFFALIPFPTINFSREHAQVPRRLLPVDAPMLQVFDAKLLLPRIPRRD